MFTQQPHGCQYILAIHPHPGPHGAQACGGFVRIECVRGNLLGSVRMNQAAAGNDELVHPAKVLATLHIGQTHQRVGFLHGTRMARHCGFTGQRTQGIIQGLVGGTRFGNPIGMGAKRIDHRSAAFLGQAGFLGDTLDSRRFDDASNGIAHTDVAFDGTLCVGLGQALEYGVRLPGHAVRHGIDIRCGTAHIDAHQVADALLALTALRSLQFRSVSALKSHIVQ